MARISRNGGGVVSDTEMRIAIAEARGARDIWIATGEEEWLGTFRHEYKGVLMAFFPGEKHCRRVPDHLNDLNAMHEAEKTLGGDNLAFYNTQLYEVSHNAPTIPYEIHGFIWHSTARQRAEAFLRTIGKWNP